MPDTSVLVAGLLAAAFAAAVVALAVAVRGTVVDPARPPSRARQWIDRQHLSQWTLLRVAAGVLAGLLVYAATRWPVAAAGVTVAAVFWPALTGGSKAEQRQINRLEAVVTWTEALRDTVTPSNGLEHAIPATAEHAGPAIRPAMLRLAGQLRTRVPLEDALTDLAAQLDHDADLIIAALLNNVRRRGGGLAQVLTGLAVAGREELDQRRQIFAGRAADRRAVRLMLLLVVIMAVFLLLVGGAYTDPYRTVAGQLVLAIVLGLFAAAFLWIRRLAASRPARPFLPSAEGLGAVDVAVVAALSAGVHPVGRPAIEWEPAP